MYPYYNRTEDGLLVKQLTKEKPLTVEEHVWLTVYAAARAMGTEHWAITAANEAVENFNKRWRND